MPLFLRVLLAVAAGVAAVLVLFGVDVDGVKVLAVGLLCVAVATLA